MNCAVMSTEIGNVCYLTVSGGLDQDRRMRQILIPLTDPIQGLRRESRPAERPPRWTPRTRDELHGGLFMVCNRAETFAVWNVILDTTTGDFDSRRGLAHIRPYLGRSRKPRANELVWLTAQTPHEMLLLENEGYRQTSVLLHQILRFGMRNTGHQTQWFRFRTMSELSRNQSSTRGSVIKHIMLILQQDKQLHRR